jgi:branched-chain amino acid transport system substrate-binding protein
MKNPVLFLAILSILGNGCNRRTPEFKVGADLPLTGTVAYYGTSAMKGIDLALDEIREENGFKNAKVQAIFEDNQGEATGAITAMNKLVDIDDVPAVIGGGSSIESMAAAPIATKSKTVLLSPISSATSLSGISPYFFRTCPSDLVQARNLAEWILQSGHDTVALIYVNSTWGTAFNGNFVNYFSSNGGRILKMQSSDPGELNFRTQLSIVKSLKPSALIAIVYAKEGGVLVRQARDLGLNIPIYGADPWSQKDFRIGAGKFADGIMYTTPVQYDGPSFDAFKAKFLKKYNEEPDVYASNGYDCMQLLADAYENGARTGPQFQSFLNHVKDFMGTTGVTTFDSNGDVVGKKFGRFLIKNGEPIQVKSR